MESVNEYSTGYRFGSRDAHRGIPVVIAEGESREYAAGYLAGYEDGRAQQAARSECGRR